MKRTVPTSVRELWYWWKFRKAYRYHRDSVKFAAHLIARGHCKCHLVKNCPDEEPITNPYKDSG